jgi:hypothetical protein
LISSFLPEKYRYEREVGATPDSGEAVCISEFLTEKQVAKSPQLW